MNELFYELGYIGLLCVLRTAFMTSSTSSDELDSSDEVDRLGLFGGGVAIGRMGLGFFPGLGKSSLSSKLVLT